MGTPPPPPGPICQEDQRATPARGLHPWVPSFSLSSWEGDAIPAPHPPGLGITVYYVIVGRVQLGLPTPERGTRPGWWLQAMAYVYASSAPPLPRAIPPDTRALVLVCQCPVHVPRGAPTAAPPPPGPNLRQAWGPVRPGRHGEHGPRGSQGHPRPARGQPPSHHNAYGGQGHLRQSPGRACLIPLGPGSPAAPRCQLERLERLVGELCPGSPACQTGGLQGPGCAGPGPARLGAPQGHRRATARDCFPYHSLRPH